MIPANQSNNPTNQPRGPAKGPVSLTHGQGPEFRTRSMAAPPSAETGQPMAPTHGGNPWPQPMAPNQPNPLNPWRGPRTRTRPSIPGEPLAKGQRGGCSEIFGENFRAPSAKRGGNRCIFMHVRSIRIPTRRFPFLSFSNPNFSPTKGQNQ